MKRMMQMETASQILPIILYTLLCVLVIVVTVFIYKLTITIDKANTVLDDVYGKAKKYRFNGRMSRNCSTMLYKIRQYKL